MSIKFVPGLYEMTSRERLKVRTVICRQAMIGIRPSIYDFESRCNAEMWVEVDADWPMVRNLIRKNYLFYGNVYKILYLKLFDIIPLSFNKQENAINVVCVHFLR
jgi:hypothetical protein